MTNLHGSRRPSAYTRQADILVNAIVNSNPAVMQIERLAPSIQVEIVTARLMGLHPVSVRWVTGEFALMFCEADCNMPRPEKILVAYYQCRQTRKNFPDGVQS